jgi:PAB1-binding protein PBP1
MLQRVNVRSAAVGFIDGMSEYELRPYREGVDMGKAEVGSRLAAGAADNKGERVYRTEVEVERERKRVERRKKNEREAGEIKNLEEEGRRVAEETNRAEVEAEERKKAVAEKKEQGRGRAGVQRKMKGPPFRVFYEYI